MAKISKVTSFGRVFPIKYQKRVMYSKEEQSGLYFRKGVIKISEKQCKSDYQIQTTILHELAHAIIDHFEFFDKVVKEFIVRSFEVILDELKKDCSMEDIRERLDMEELEEEFAVIFEKAVYDLIKYNPELVKEIQEDN